MAIDTDVANVPKPITPGPEMEGLARFHVDIAWIHVGQADKSAITATPYPAGGAAIRAYPSAVADSSRSTSTSRRPPIPCVQSSS